MMTVRKFIPLALLLLLVAAGVWSWMSGGIAYEMLRTDVDSETRMLWVKQFFLNIGPLASVAYVVFVTIEVVVAPIPGLMLYAPGGIIFGPVLGGTLSLVGNILGAGIACGVTRLMGSNWLSRLVDQEKVEQVQAELELRGTLLIFLLRLNPLTSSDFISYAAGFSRIPVWKVMFATGCGMAPLCFAQAWLAESLLTSFPQLLYPLVAACVIYLVAVVVVMRRILSPA